MDLTCEARSSHCLLFFVVDIKQVIPILKLVLEEVDERRLSTNGSQLLGSLVRVIVHVCVVAVDGVLLLACGVESLGDLLRAVLLN